MRSCTPWPSGSAPDCCTHPEGSTMPLDNWATTSPASGGIPAALGFACRVGFRRQVLDHLVTIGYGHQESYAAVANLTGHPKAIRAVGSACATNPIPIIVPCHRVLRSDGTLGGYIGGLAAKQALLRLEGTR